MPTNSEDETSKDIDPQALGKEWTLVEVKKLLRAIPPLARTARQKAIKAEFNLEEAKLETKKQRAIAQLKASSDKATNGLTSAEDRKAWVQTQPNVEKAEAEELVAKANQLIYQSHYDYLVNMFSAVRKTANLMQDEYQDQKRVERDFGEQPQG